VAETLAVLMPWAMSKTRLAVTKLMWFATASPVHAPSPAAEKAPSFL